MKKYSLDEIFYQYESVQFQLKNFRAASSLYLGKDLHLIIYRKCEILERRLENLRTIILLNLSSIYRK